MTASLSNNDYSPPPTVFHVSEDGGIDRFRPRPVRDDHPLGIRQPVIWAIGGRLLHNYLLPRDCPRVCFFAGPETSASGSPLLHASAPSGYVIAIESTWLARVMTTRLFCYELPGETFRMVDPIAEYWVSEQEAEPLAVRAVANPLVELAARHVELRVCPSLWPLHDIVAATTLDFSMIRMTNAQPR